MINRKTFLITSTLVLVIAMFCATFVVASLKPQLHKSFMLELINVKIKK